MTIYEVTFLPDWDAYSDEVTECGICAGDNFDEALKYLYSFYGRDNLITAKLTPYDISALPIKDPNLFAEIQKVAIDVAY